MLFCRIQFYYHGFDFTSASQISFSILSMTAWSRDGAHLWRNCWCTLKFEHYTQYRWKRCLPKGPWGLCIMSTMTRAAGPRDLCACTDVAPEGEPRCCLWETHKSWAHGPWPGLAWNCSAKTSIGLSEVAKRPKSFKLLRNLTFQFSHTTLARLSDSFVQSEMQFPGVAATWGVQSKRGSISGVKLSKAERFVEFFLSTA